MTTTSEQTSNIVLCGLQTDFLRTDNRAAGNSTLAIGGVSSPLDSFVVAESSVLRTNYCAEKPAHRQSAKRWQQHRWTKSDQELNEENNILCLVLK